MWAPFGAIGQNRGCTANLGMPDAGPHWAVCSQVLPMRASVINGLRRCRWRNGEAGLGKTAEVVR